MTKSDKSKKKNKRKNKWGARILIFLCMVH